MNSNIITFNERSRKSAEHIENTYEVHSRFRRPILLFTDNKFSHIMTFGNDLDNNYNAPFSEEVILRLKDVVGEGYFFKGLYNSLEYNAYILELEQTIGAKAAKDRIRVYLGKDGHLGKEYSKPNEEIIRKNISFIGRPRLRSVERIKSNVENNYTLTFQKPTSIHNIIISNNIKVSFW